ncbi:MAG: hypothetical protein ACK40G_04265 [Cytophagaceae bacterium]
MKNPNYVLEDVDKQREILEKETGLFKEAVESDLKMITADAKKIGFTLLLLGGACAAAYLVTRAIIPSKPKKEKKVTSAPADGLIVTEPKRESEIVKMIKEQIALFLIALVKEKLTSYLKSLDSKKE